MTDWFPNTPYYREHADRLRLSFDSLGLTASTARVLCVGSWGGETAYLKHLGAREVHCIRAPGEGIPASAEINGAMVHGFDVESKWPDIGLFDVVLMWEVLEHLRREPTRMLYEAILHTRQNGLLSLTTPNALWHVLTMAQVFGSNALGLKLQLHIPYATHWRLWSPAEVAECFSNMGCKSDVVTSLIRAEPYPTIKSRLAVRALELLRRNSGNGECSVGQHVLVNARKRSEPEMIYTPGWLFPKTEGIS